MNEQHTLKHWRYSSYTQFNHKSNNDEIKIIVWLDDKIINSSQIVLYSRLMMTHIVDQTPITLKGQLLNKPGNDYTLVTITTHVTLLTLHF